MMNEETKLERWLVHSVARATTPRGATIVIWVATLTVVFVAGLVMTVIDRRELRDVGLGPVVGRADGDDGRLRRPRPGDDCRSHRRRGRHAAGNRCSVTVITAAITARGCGERTSSRSRTEQLATAEQVRDSRSGSSGSKRRCRVAPSRYAASRSDRVDRRRPRGDLGVDVLDRRPAPLAQDLGRDVADDDRDDDERDQAWPGSAAGRAGPRRAAGAGSRRWRPPSPQRRRRPR